MKHIISIVCLTTTLLGSSFFQYATLYTSGSLHTPYIFKDQEQTLDDDYNFNLGVRKIAKYSYQGSTDFFKGDEISPTDNATLGAVKGFEYLFNISAIQDRGNQFLDKELWLRYTQDYILLKVKYLEKPSRELKIAQGDVRLKFPFKNVNISLGGAFRMHPAYGVNPYEEGWYDNAWYQLAYDYGYEDGSYIVNDLNNNDILDSYYIWIEIDEYTGDGYWEYFEETMNWYWQDPEGNEIANSDEEFMQYHFNQVIEQYNQSEIDKLGWQQEISTVLGIDGLVLTKSLYLHFWGNLYPYSIGLSDYSYDEMQYDLGVMLGINILEQVGLFWEGVYFNYYGKQEYSTEFGINYQFN